MYSQEGKEYPTYNRNCLLKHVIVGRIGRQIEGTGRRRRRCKQLLGGLKEKRKHWNLKEEDVDRILWGIPFRRGHELVDRHTEYL